MTKTFCLKYITKTKSSKLNIKTNQLENGQKTCTIISPKMANKYKKRCLTY